VKQAMGIASREQRPLETQATVRVIAIAASRA
jgi:hypothetical protein